MDQKKYTLTWHTYPDHLMGMMREMMTSDIFADVTLVCDDKKSIRAHRNILSACSPVFKDILQMHTQSNHPVIYMRGVQHSEMESILQFMYVGEVRLYEERTNEFMCMMKDLEINSDDTVESNNAMQQTETDQKISLSENHTLDKEDNKEDIVGSNNAMQQSTEAGKEFSCKPKFQCQQCDKTYSDRSNLRQHNMSKHDGVKYACNQCDQQFTAQSILTLHIKSKHEGVKYTCKQCNQRFAHPRGLTKHIQSAHEGVRYACNQCDKQFTTQQHLTRHIQSIHEGVKFACNQCDYQGSKDALTFHLKKRHSVTK